MNNRFFWRVIRDALERRGLGQGDVPGIPQPRISEWTSGRVSIPEDTLIRVATALGTTAQQLLREHLDGDPVKPGPKKASPKKKP